MQQDSRRFEVHPRRRWTLIAEYLSNGQQTARWFRDNDSGDWYMAESWKRPNVRAGRLNADCVACIVEIMRTGSHFVVRGSDGVWRATDAAGVELAS